MSPHKLFRTCYFLDIGVGGFKLPLLLLFALWSKSMAWLIWYLPFGAWDVVYDKKNNKSSVLDLNNLLCNYFIHDSIHFYILILLSVLYKFFINYPNIWSASFTNYWEFNKLSLHDCWLLSLSTYFHHFLSIHFEIMILAAWDITSYFPENCSFYYYIQILFILKVFFVKII